MSKTKKQVNETFGFKRPINQPTAIYGHFGKPNFPKPEDSKDAGIYWAQSGFVMRSREEALQCYRIETAKGCFYRMMKDPIWGQLTLKWPVKGGVEAAIPFHYPEGLVERVTLAEFVEQEAHRLPIFLGASHIGIYPKYSVLDPIPDGYLHFIISKSILSGHVNSLNLQRWDAHEQVFHRIKQWM